MDPSASVTPTSTQPPTPAVSGIYPLTSTPIARTQGQAITNSHLESYSSFLLGSLSLC